MRCWASLVVLAVAASGCGHNIRALATEESTYYTKLHKAVAENGEKIKLAVDDLAIIEEHAVRQERANGLTRIARAKLLDQMPSLWRTVPPNLVETQKAVALERLYDLEAAEEAAVSAALAEREAARAEVVAAWQKMLSVLDDAIDKQKVLLQYLNQPPNAQVSGFLTEFSTQAAAFKTELDVANDPRLQSVAAAAGQASDRGNQARFRLDELITKLTELKGKP
jgi:hypothetical protein